jgi:hypothetical protein
MHSVEMIECAIDLAKRLGYEIRQDWLGGANGGGCELRGTKWLFLDLSLSPEERLEQLADALADDPRVADAHVPTELRTYFNRRSEPH